jgi:hypothetical protein
MLNGVAEENDFNVRCPNPICRIGFVTLSAEDPESSFDLLAAKWIHWNKSVA